MARRGWLRVWGGTTDSTVVTLAARAPLDSASAAVGQIIAAEAAWMSSHAINNSSSRGDWLAVLSPSALPTRRAQFFEQRERAGLIELALIVDAYALEPDFPRHAARIRRAARAFGVIASFLGDSLALDFESDAATARLKMAAGIALVGGAIDGSAAASRPGTRARAQRDPRGLSFYEGRNLRRAAAGQSSAMAFRVALGALNTARVCGR